jgi:hypothetical protein
MGFVGAVRLCPRSFELVVIRLGDLRRSFDGFDISMADVDDFGAVEHVAFGRQDFAFNIAPAEFGAGRRAQECMFLADSNAVCRALGR